MGEVIVVIGAGSIGQAIARRVSSGKQVLLADLHQGNADAAAEVLSNAGFEVSTATVDVSSRESVHALVQMRRHHRCHPRRRRLAQPGAAGDDPGRGPLRNRPGTRGIRQRHRARRRRDRHRVTVRTPSRRTDRRTRRHPCHDADRGIARAAHARARPGRSTIAVAMILSPVLRDICAARLSGALP